MPPLETFTLYGQLDINEILDFPSAHHQYWAQKLLAMLMSRTRLHLNYSKLDDEIMQSADKFSVGLAAEWPDGIVKRRRACEVHTGLCIETLLLITAIVLISLVCVGRHELRMWSFILLWCFSYITCQKFKWSYLTVCINICDTWAQNPSFVVSSFFIESYSTLPLL